MERDTGDLKFKVKMHYKVDGQEKTVDFAGANAEDVKKKADEFFEGIKFDEGSRWGEPIESK
jgi:hypothetical protein